MSDIVVSPSDVRASELVLNNHARCWVGMFKIGENEGQVWRVNRALISKFTSIPPLQGLRKNHIDADPAIGPKLRPLYLLTKHQMPLSAICRQKCAMGQQTTCKAGAAQK